jgi:hypothetical protein
VDVALFIDVLTDKTMAGRDLGMLVVAMNVGQSLARLLAA